MAKFRDIKKIAYKRRNAYSHKFHRSWIVVFFAFIAFGTIFLYIQSSKVTSKSLPKSIHQFAKDLYHDNHSPGKESHFKPRDFCEVIHIGVVCSGFNSNVHFHALLKSLFLTRANPIHFHFLVSNESDTVLRVLFKTWQVPQVNVSFYNINPWLKEVRWIPNGHYSGNYGLLKLIFNKVIPSNATTKLLVLDTDLIINDDIYLLWKLFEDFNSRQAIGIAENQSPYYLGQLNQAHPWPALNTGFNSGIMLYDLDKLNAIRWDEIWVNLTKRFTLIYGQADLGDQDILNSVLLENPELLYKLPCYWNVQMSGHSTSSSCYNKSKPKIVHWNSPQKFAVATADGEKFRGLANSVFEMNGNWFRTYPQMCKDDRQIHLNIEPLEDCQKFNKPVDMFYRTLLFFFDYKYVADDWDITYVTHLSFDRSYLMETVARIWTGPISFTLYVSDSEFAESMKLILESELLSGRKDIAYHAVFKQGEFYPINTLRNTGLKYVKTPYAFLVDIDFVPMKSLCEILKDTVKSMGDLQKKALIVPAFETTKPDVVLPKSKIQLLESLKRKEVRQFLADVWAPGHNPTDYEKWGKEYEPYQVKWQAHYEPYIMVKSNVVPYDERFLGFGWNKVSHIMELEAQNYDFIVLSDVFIIHEPHKTSLDNMRYKKSSLYRKCVQSLKKRFVHELHKKYNKTFTDVNYSEEWNRKRRKRNAAHEYTTTSYDSTDHFLVWGGKEKAEKKKEPKKSFSEPQIDNHDSSDPLTYDYYESEHPYNLTVIKLNPNNVNTKQIKLMSSEEHEYEYDQEDSNFKDMHDSTTVSCPEDYFASLTDEELKNAQEHNLTLGCANEKSFDV